MILNLAIVRLGSSILTAVNHWKSVSKPAVHNRRSYLEADLQSHGRLTFIQIDRLGGDCIVEYLVCSYKISDPIEALTL